MWGVLWLVLFGLMVAWRAQNLDAFGLSNDEGVYLMWGRLVAEGYSLYSETVAVQPPLFFESLAAAFRLAGDTVSVGRWAMMSGFALLAVTLSWLAHKMAGWPAAIAALLLLSLSPLVFVYSRLAMAELPSTGLATLSVVLVTLFVQHNRRGWLLAAGLVLGFSLIFKTINPFVVAPVGVLLLLHRAENNPNTIPPLSFILHPSSFSLSNRPALLLDVLLYGLSAALPVLAVFVLYDAGAAYDQLITFRGDLRAAIPGSWPETWQHFRLFLSTHWSFWLLAVAGIILTISDLGFTVASPNRNSQFARVCPAVSGIHNSQEPAPQYRAFAIQLAAVVWLLAGVALLLWHSPLFAHHFVVLLPPLILLSAAFIGRIVDCWQAGGGSMPLRVAATAVAALALFSVPAMVQANTAVAAIVTGGREQDALNLLSDVTQPDDFVMGDSQLLVFMANRRTPPPLGDLALVGIKAGRQTSPRLIEITQQFQSPAVVRWALRLPWLPQVRGLG